MSVKITSDFNFMLNTGKITHTIIIIKLISNDLYRITRQCKEHCYQRGPVIKNKTIKKTLKPKGSLYTTGHQGKLTFKQEVPLLKGIAPPTFHTFRVRAKCKFVLLLSWHIVESSVLQTKHASKSHETKIYY